jgi:hypothetical protein
MFTLEFALQLRRKHGKTSVRVRKTSVSYSTLMGSLGLWTGVGVTVEVRLHRVTGKKELQKIVEAGS